MLFPANFLPHIPPNLSKPTKARCLPPALSSSEPGKAIWMLSQLRVCCVASWQGNLGKTLAWSHFSERLPTGGEHRLLHLYCSSCSELSSVLFPSSCRSVPSLFLMWTCYLAMGATKLRNNWCTFSWPPASTAACSWRQSAMVVAPIASSGKAQASFQQNLCQICSQCSSGWVAQLCRKTLLLCSQESASLFAVPDHPDQPAPKWSAWDASSQHQASCAGSLGRRVEIDIVTVTSGCPPFSCSWVKINFALDVVELEETFFLQ